MTTFLQMIILLIFIFTPSVAIIVLVIGKYGWALPCISRQNIQLERVVASEPPSFITPYHWMDEDVVIETADTLTTLTNKILTQQREDEQRPRKRKYASLAKASTEEQEEFHRMLGIAPVERVKFHCK